MQHTTAPDKNCVVCGKSCEGQPRTKDPKGRYFHANCYKIAAERCRAGRRSVQAQMSTVPPSGVMDEILNASDSHAAVVAPCTGCGMPMAEGAKICTGCGFEPSVGHTVRTKSRHRPSLPGGGLGFSPAFLRTPFGLGVGVAAILCIAASLSLVVYFILSVLLALGLVIGVLVGTWRSSPAHVFGLFVVPMACLAIAFAIVLPVPPAFGGSFSSAEGVTLYFVALGAYYVLFWMVLLVPCYGIVAVVAGATLAPAAFVVVGLALVYAFYVVFAVCDSQYVRWLFVAQWVSGGFALLIGVASAMSGAMG